MRRLQYVGLILGVGTLAVSTVGCRPEGASPEAKQGSTSTVQQIEDAYKSFHADTGGWPMGGAVWSPKTGVQIDPIQLDFHDTALFKLPSNAKQCSAQVQRPCWNGPYLKGTSFADSQWTDAWGHAPYVMMMRPFDGMGGGSRLAQNGLVVLWSAGPDGKDGFGCSDGNCARDWNRLAKGLPSDSNADDLVTVVGAVN